MDHDDIDQSQSDTNTNHYSNGNEFEERHDKEGGPSDESSTEMDTGPSLRSPSVDDVFAVRHDLTRFMPLELADSILEAAMYWPKISTSRTEPLIVKAGHDSPSDTAAYYVVTPPIPYVQNSLTPVRKVRFSLRSHDQGWGGDAWDHGACFLQYADKVMLSACVGTYVGSWTWFEAAIIRDDDPGIEQYLLELDTMNVARQKELPKVRLAEVGTPPDGLTRWPIQRNIHVSSAFERHEVVWTNEDRFDEATEANAAVHGSGTGRGFLSTLTGGDRVAVVVRARVSAVIILRRLPRNSQDPQFSGWENHVSSVTVDVFYSV
jgi:hypothetical protein